ncbi:MAG: hypothetical protein ACJASL_000127 [Paraglaciecola sp.]
MNDYIESLRLANQKIAELEKSDAKWLNLVVKLGEDAVEMDNRFAELDALVFQSYIEGYSDSLDGDSKLAESWKNSATIGDLKAIKDKS